MEKEVDFSGEDKDLELVNRVKAGDEIAFERLVSDYQKRIFAFCYRMLLNSADAEDAAQEAFIKAYKNIKGFKGESKFSTWLYMIAKNTCLDKFRSKSPKASIDEFLADPKPLPEELYAKKEREMILMRGVERLDEMHRVALSLIHFEGLSYEEASHIMECEIGTAKTRVNRGLEQLGRLLREMLKEKKREG
jgi:RNA polymerase sigma-70 factor (ECF subfamily)